MSAYQQTVQSNQYDREGTPSVTEVAFSAMFQLNIRLFFVVVSYNPRCCNLYE